MPPFVGRCRCTFALPLVAAIAFAGAGTAAPEPVTLKEHTGWVGGVAFSPDGNTLATASADKTAKLWDVKTGKELLTLKGHTDYVACVAFSPNGKELLTGSYDHTAKFWDAKTGKELVTLRGGHKGAVLAVAFRPDGALVVTGGIDGTLLLWATDRDRELLSILEHKSWVNAIAFSPENTRLGITRFASASSDNTVGIWDTIGPMPLRTLKPKAAEIRSVAYSPDGKLLAAGTRYGITKVWDVKKGEEVASLKGKHTGEVWAVAFSSDGKWLAVSDGDWNKPSDVVLYDTKTWKEHTRLKHTNEVLSIAWHPKKPIVAAGAWDKTVRVWNLSEAKDK